VSEHAADGAETVVAPSTLPRRMWLVTLVLGALLWAAVAVAIALTDNTILVPNLILLGTFLVPVCTVPFVLARPREAHLSIEALIIGFLAGGMVGVVLAGTTDADDHVPGNRRSGRRRCRCGLTSALPTPVVGVTTMGGFTFGRCYTR
jgi:hypothetical protein